MIDPLLALFVLVLAISLIVNSWNRSRRRRSFDQDQRTLRQRFGDLPIIEWWLTAALLFIGAWIVSPENAKVIVYKIAVTALAACMGWALDRRLFPNARPESFEPEDKPDLMWAVTMCRRAFIIGCVIHGVTSAL